LPVIALTLVAAMCSHLSGRRTKLVSEALAVEAPDQPPDLLDLGRSRVLTMQAE
jgi:hypothetical protein